MLILILFQNIFLLFKFLFTFTLMDKSEYVTVSQFAKAHQVPEQAVLNAIHLGKLKVENTTIVNNEQLIHVKHLVDYKFDLISAYDFAARKGVSYVAVYSRTKNKKNPILFSLDERSDLIKIDWELYHDAHFRKFEFRFRNKNQPA